jgi:hypothetical protein
MGNVEENYTRLLLLVVANIQGDLKVTQHIPDTYSIC